MSFKNKCFYAILFTLCLSLGVRQNLYSQGKAFMYKDEHGIERSMIRQILNKFSLTVMTGYGRTFYSHELENFSLLQKDSYLYIIDSSTLNISGPNVGYRNWTDKPEYVEGVFVDVNDVVVTPDTTKIGFEARGTSIPVILSLQYNISRFRIGLGVAAEYHTIKKVVPTFEESYLNAYKEKSISTLQTRIFGSLGVEAYEYWDYTLVVDAQFGKHSRGSAFNKDHISQGMYLNLGLPIEKNLSEYFRVVLRPAYEFSGYTINLPESEFSIKHRAPMFYIQAGISLTYPEIARCPIKSCQTQMKHIHFGREYRGQPLHKKQNPGYGENHPELDMYKGRKKGKRNVQ